MKNVNSGELLARRVSTALALVAGATSAASFLFWQLFHRDSLAGVGNLRGTALTMLVIALPLLIASMDFARVLSRTTTSIYLLVCAAAFAGLWLLSVIPAITTNTMPPTIADSRLTQNTVWVLDFTFTFPLMIIGALWLWKRRPWGYVIGGMMVIMLTIETASIGFDQVFGNLHDPSAPLAAVPAMLVFTAAGATFSALFLERIDTVPATRKA